MKTFEQHLEEQSPDTLEILKKDNFFAVFSFWAEDYARSLLKKELPKDVQEALNSGDGTYKP